MPDLKIRTKTPFLSKQMMNGSNHLHNGNRIPLKIIFFPNFGGCKNYFEKITQNARKDISLSKTKPGKMNARKITMFEIMTRNENNLIYKAGFEFFSSVRTKLIYFSTLNFWHSIFHHEINSTLEIVSHNKINSKKI